MKNEDLFKFELKQSLFKYYGLKVNKIEKINHTFTDCYIIYASDKYFVKVFNNEQDIYKIKQENELLNFLKDKGFNVPYIIKNKEGNVYTKVAGYYLFLENFIQGYAYTDEKINEDELLKSAKLLGKMHQVLNNQYDDLNKEDYWKNINIEKEKDYLNSILNELKVLPKDTNYEIIEKAIKHKLRMLPQLKEMSKRFDGITYVMTHGDYSKRNLLKDAKENIYIIDFSDAGVYPAAFEVIRSYFISTDSCKNENSFDHNLFFKYVKSYLEEFPLNKKDLELMPYLFLYQILTSNYRYQEYIETKDEKYLNFIKWKENMSLFLEANADKISEFISLS